MQWTNSSTSSYFATSGSLWFEIIEEDEGVYLMAGTLVDVDENGMSDPGQDNREGTYGPFENVEDAKRFAEKLALGEPVADSLHPAGF